MRNPATRAKAERVKTTLETLQRNDWTIPFGPSAATLARQEMSPEPDINQQLRELLAAPTVEEEDEVLNRDTRVV
jgi:hypothetical protein